MKTKTFLLQGRPFIIIGILSLSVYACTKTEELSDTHSGNPGKEMMASTLTATKANNPFKITVGAPIEVATGNQWIENFKKVNGGLGKEYTMAGKDLQAILSDRACVGICLYFAIDENQTAHLLPIGINANGMMMKSKQINTSMEPISWETAQKWIANDLGVIDARFFGRYTFDRLFNTPNCLTIRAISALDDQKKPQLLLANAALDYSTANKQNASGWLKYEDASAVCPPICPFGS